MKTPMHVFSLENIALSFEASEEQPGYVIVKVTTDNQVITMTFDPQDGWPKVMCMLPFVARDAHDILLAACHADNQTNPNLN